MNSNDLMVWLLRSPFHGMFSDGMLLITVDGRESGRKYTLPVAYFHGEGVLWVLTRRKRTWWRNVRDGGRVSLLLKRRLVEAFAVPELDEASVEILMHEYLKLFPQAVRSLGIDVKDGILNADDIVRAAKESLFVRIEPT